MQRIEGLSEDWLAVWIGLAIFILSLGAAIGLDLLGFAAAPKTWIELGKAVKPAGEGFAALGGFGALLVTFIFVLALMLAAAWALGADLRRFALSFTVIFWLAYLCWIAGNFAYIAVTTPADMEKFGVPWSLKLTGESGYLIALLVALFPANVWSALNHTGMGGHRMGPSYLWLRTPVQLVFIVWLWWFSRDRSRNQLQAAQAAGVP